MKIIYKLARTELQTLFYSPIAWLIIVIFTFQITMVFTGLLAMLTHNQSLGYLTDDITFTLFTNAWGGVFTKVQEYLYLYLPLLTMGLMSRELSSGSIKLLYSSPITNTQIILGKFLSMMIYGLILIGILFILVLFSVAVVKEFDMSAVLSGLLGLYLLLCAYAAIGLFMSSLTSYQVVAAICTLVMLAVLNYVRVMWQDVEFIRDITYWLSISGRCSEFVAGIICSEDVLYFIILIALFLFLTIIRLQDCRQKNAWTETWGKYMGVFCVAMLLGYFSSQPKLMFFYDATQTKNMTLTPNSQQVVNKLKDGLTITSYTNLFDSRNLWVATPKSINEDLRRFKQYTRFKPGIKMKYEYYYDTMPSARILGPSNRDTLRDWAEKAAKNADLKFKIFKSPEEIKQQIDLLSEGNKFVRELVRENGEKTFLRVFDDMKKFPSEREITAAFKRLIMDIPKVGFLQGHGERDNNREGDRNYRRFAQDKPFRHALINQGFDIENVILNGEIPVDINILFIAEMKSSLTEIEQFYMDKYIERGGNLMILGEPKRREFMEPLVARFGVHFVPGVLVQFHKDFEADFIQVHSSSQAIELSYNFGEVCLTQASVTMPSVAGLELVSDKGYKMTPLFVTDSLCWNEVKTTDFVDDTTILNSELGEIQKSYITGMALSKQVGSKEQKIIILGDADCISNGEITRDRRGVWAANYAVIDASFYWLSDNEVPIDVRRPKAPDDKIFLTREASDNWSIVLQWMLPILMGLFAIFVWMRRRGR